MTTATITPITDPQRLLTYCFGLPKHLVLVASPIYRGTRYNIYEQLVNYDQWGNHWATLTPIYVVKAGLRVVSDAGYGGVRSIHDAREWAMQDSGIVYGQHQPAGATPEERHRAHWQRTLTADHILADAGMRAAAAEQAAQWKSKSSASGILGWAGDAVVAEAVQRMRVRLIRRADRAAAEAALIGDPGRIGRMNRERGAERCKSLALAIAATINAIHPLTESQYAHTIWGSTGGEESVEWNHYSRRTKYPCKYHNAGVTLGDDLRVRIYDSRSNHVYTSRPLTRHDWLASDPAARAQMILHAVSTEQLDAVGPQGEDDAVQIRRPYLICRSKRGIVIADTPASVRDQIVQVVVSDSTTGQRHHLTVPPRFGRPLADDETPIQRVRAAVAWTFRLPAKSYRPAIET